MRGVGTPSVVPQNVASGKRALCEVVDLAWGRSGDQHTVLARYMEGPALLERTLAGLRDVDLDAAPSGGGWSIRQIVHHIVDGDDLWKSCIKAALGNTDGKFTLDWYWRVPQDTWADRWAYARRSLVVSLALLRASRAHELQLLEQVPEAWDRSVELLRPKGETTRLSVGAVVEMQADHLVHHVDRIVAIRREREAG